MKIKIIITDITDDHGYWLVLHLLLVLL